MEVIESSEYSRWIRRLRDLRAQAVIDVRIRRLSLGNRGDVKSLGDGLYELRIHYGPGYRVYFSQFGTALVVLLVGGDKSRQERDIGKARQVAAAWRSQHGG
ncbi:type II toxin-antitoxin system RelE/ParE family toxin [Sphingomonas sp.]|uniref:type II toxin-antitoxin system RelE/ParE family toxin n=1 Tax=Sphingomonas sp. TaxID=28214 RepID=UPI002DEE58F0|nr:type II toxin-antitoxin system RelE/ParE family toxin [Sphingomonas sp.]HEV2569017.1 type II toxin-antitoxin system RelE/ParE family toxin [Sphingomonas sp.]